MMTSRRDQRLGELAARPTFRTIDGLSIRFVESEPRNSDALLLSPWPESVFAYEPTWSRLAEETHLIAIDLPGFGRSERRDALMSPRAMGEFIVRAADAFGLEKPHVVGPDIGTSAVAVRRGRTPRIASSASSSEAAVRPFRSTRRAVARMGVCARPRTVSTARWTHHHRARDSDARALCAQRRRSRGLPGLVRRRSIRGIDALRAVVPDRA